MNPVIKILSLASCFLFCFTGCKKDNDSSAGYLKGKIDGVAFECSSNIWATTERSGDKFIAFRGDWSGGSIRFSLDGQGANITSGSYDFVTGIERNAVLYEANDGYSAGYFCAFFSPCTFYGSGKITIDKISNRRINGTFEFITPVNGATGKSKTVTNGEFNIKRE